MSWKPVVAGVDSSPESAWAAAVAADLARAARTTCHLVHVTRDEWSALALAERPEQAQEFSASHMAQARGRVEYALAGAVAPNIVDRMTVRVGRAAAELKLMVAELGAGLVVLGGKHHSTLERWLAGSTSINVVRTTEVPVLVTGGSRSPIRRVLAAVDLSAAARPTIEAAERFAEVFGAKLRVVSALEPLPIIPEAPNYELSHYYAMMEEQLAHDVWPLVQSPYAEKVTRHGTALDAVLEEAADWHADVVVVGSHGKGLVDRVLIGSVTERLLNHLPTSLLVVPVHAVGAAQDAVKRMETRPAFA
jgi:nucleotide-binding universal stress UspA family protein